MSIDFCGKCQRMVDTDDHPDAYEVEDHDCNTVKLEYALCGRCKQNFADLMELMKKVDAFTSDIFDFVSLLRETEFLGRCYEFKSAIEKYIDPKMKGETNGK